MTPAWSYQREATLTNHSESNSLENFLSCTKENGDIPEFTFFRYNSSLLGPDGKNNLII